MKTAGMNSVKPMTSHETRFVATYSIATNNPKNSSEVPRSRWRTRIAMPISHTTMMGPRSRARGSRIPRKLRPPSPGIIGSSSRNRESAPKVYV